jgi:hypothetical protein
VSEFGQERADRGVEDATFFHRTRSPTAVICDRAASAA